MKNITVSIPDELYRCMHEYEWVNWSAVARIAFISIVEAMEEGDLTQHKVEAKAIKLLLEILKQ